MQKFFHSIEVTIIKENFLIIKKEAAAIKNSSIKQVFCKMLFSNVAAPYSCSTKLLIVVQLLEKQEKNIYFAESLSMAASESINCKSTSI